MKTTDIIMEAVRARIDHPEDWIWRNGNKGYQAAISALDYAQKHTSEITLKYDGTPSLIVGRNDDGQLVITDKSGFGATTYNGHPTTAKSLYLMLYGRKPNEQGRHEYASTIASLWNLFEKAIPKSTRGYYQGDLLYAGTPPIENDAFTFKPNKIQYTVPVNSETGNRIAQSKAGIVFHGYFKNRNQSVPEEITDVSELSTNPALFVISATMPPNSIEAINPPKFDFSDIDEVIDPTILRVNKISDFSRLVGRYINDMARAGNPIDNNSADAFLKWLPFSKTTLDKQDRISKFVDQHKKQYIDMWKAILTITKFKNMIKSQLDQVQGADITANLNGNPTHEGYVISTPSGKIKLVDRYTYMAKQEAPENENN